MKKEHEDITNYIGVSGPLTLDETEFYLAWSQRPSDFYFLQEYLPEGASLEHFGQMLAIHLTVNHQSLEEAVQFKIEELEKRMESDPICTYQVNQIKDTDQYILDCMMSSGYDTPDAVAEFIIYRYIPYEISDEMFVLFVYAYSQRAYGSDVPDFLAFVDDEYEHLLDSMVQAELPPFQI